MTGKEGGKKRGNEDVAGGWKQEKDFFGEVRDSYSNFQFGKDKN